MTATATRSLGDLASTSSPSRVALDQCALHAMHDAIESTMEQYGTHVIPAVRADRPVTG